MILRVSVTLLVVLTAVSSIKAQEGDGPPYHIGESRTVHHGGIRYECFDLNGYIGLLRLDADYHHLSVQHPLALAQVQQQEAVVSALLRTEAYYSVQLTILNEERSRLQEMWAEENRLRLEAENTPSFSTKLAWSLAFTFAAISLGLGVVVLIGE